MFHAVLILFGVAVFSVAVLRRLKLPPILGYLLTGWVVGPVGIGLVEDTHDLHYVAEFGVVFLLFTIGLELSLPKIIAMRRPLLTLGGLQVLLCCSIVLAVSYFAGFAWAGAVTVAGALTLSSTAVGIKLLVEQNELHASHGRMALSILLFQDLAAVPFLILVPALALPEAGEASLAPLLGITLAKGFFVFAIILLAGRWLIRPLLHQVALGRSTELFMLTALLIVMVSAFLTEEFGLSLALGGFLAGAVLAETEYCHQIESDIQPFRDILLGLFFVTVGMKIDPMATLQEWVWVLAILIALIVVKFGIITALARFFGQVTLACSIRTGLVLAQGGEFGFALLTLAAERDVLSDRAHQITLSAIILSMIIAPFLIRHNERIANWLGGSNDEEGLKAMRAQSLADVQHQVKGHVIICGFGRVGQALARFLEPEGIPYIGLDMDPRRLKEALAAKEPVYYADASQIENLEKAGIADAKLLILSVNDDVLTQRTLQNVRNHGFRLPILVRTRDEKHLADLQQSGATEIVPETLEASLTLASHMLMLLGQPAQKVQQQMLDVHKSRYQLLRGFFAGDDDAVHLEDAIGSQVETLHAVELVHDAWAIGKTTEELTRSGLKLNIASFSRDGYKSAAPEENTPFKAGDVLVLRGKKEALYLAEEKLLQGK